MSLKEETLLQDQTVQATSVAMAMEATGIVEAMDTVIVAFTTKTRAPTTQELATEVSGLKQSRLATVMRNSLSALEYGFATLRPRNTLATIATVL